MAMATWWHSACLDSTTRGGLDDLIDTGHAPLMNGMLLIMTADTEEHGSVSSLLAACGYASQKAASATELREKLQGGAFSAVLLDLDTVVLDNRTIRVLTLEFPVTPFLCLSSERLHPELQDSIRDHIYACLTKPIDPDELSYWLKCIQDDRAV